MKKTGFYNQHKDLNAKMVSFAGFEMPIQYPKGIIHEHKVVRNTVGVFDVTHMGEFFVQGPEALNLVQKLITNDASKLEIGQVLYTAMCYENGGIVDDLLTYKLADDHYMLVVNGSKSLRPVVHSVFRNFTIYSQNRTGTQQMTVLVYWQTTRVST